ncbi:MAG TPA: hypothetical protein VL225_11250 [Vicinamibacterales bacterium]|nr:hypothetical protein [Vicinamibacterales bacterium]
MSTLLGLQSLSLNPDVGARAQERGPAARTSELTLADVLARGVVIEWFEAVALARATWDGLEGASGHVSTPDLGQIWLNRNGTIRVSGVSYDDEPVRRVGQLLQALLNRSEPPVTLRLVVGNATAHVPVYRDVQELDEAIAYFERPDRPAVLRALFARAESGHQSVPADAPPSLDDVAPLPAPVRTPRTAAALSMRRLAALAVITMVASVTTVLALRAYLLGARVPVARIAGAAQRATDSFTGAMVTGISAVTESVGLGRLSLKPATAETAAQAASRGSAPRVARQRALLPTVGVIRAFDLENAPVALAPSMASAIAVPVSAPTPVEARTPAPVAPPDTAIYSAESREVVPPTAIRPQLPRVLPEGVAAADLSGIELVVERDGSVESVKLVHGRRPASVKDAMLLSAAKTWRFAPATKERVPVRYRKTIWIISE